MIYTERKIVLQKNENLYPDRNAMRITRIVAEDGTVFLIKAKIRQNTYKRQCSAETYVFTENKEWSLLLDFPWDDLRTSWDVPEPLGGNYPQDDLKAKRVMDVDFTYMMDVSINILLASLPSNEKEVRAAG